MVDLRESMSRTAAPRRDSGQWRLPLSILPALVVSLLMWDGLLHVLRVL